MDSAAQQVGYEDAWKRYGVHTRLKSRRRDFYGKNQAFKKMKAQKRTGKPVNKEKES